MVVERRAYLGHDADLESPDQAHLHKPQAPVQYQHQSDGDIQDGAAALQYGDADEQAHGPGARVPHQQAAGRGIVPQVSQDAGGEQQYEEGEILPGPQDPVHHVDRHDGNDGQRPGEPVHPVGAVGHVHGHPYQHHDQHGEHGLWDFQHGMVEQRKLNGIVIIMKERHGHQDGHAQIQDPFFELAPGLFRGIVQKTSQHADDDQYQIDHEFRLHGHEQDRRCHKGQHEDDPSASGLPGGQLAVMGELPPSVLGQVLAELCRGIHCGDEREQNPAQGEKRGMLSGHNILQHIALTYNCRSTAARTASAAVSIINGI